MNKDKVIMNSSTFDKLIYPETRLRRFTRSVQPDHVNDQNMLSIPILQKLIIASLSLSQSLLFLKDSIWEIPIDSVWIMTSYPFRTQISSVYCEEVIGRLFAYTE